MTDGPGPIEAVEDDHTDRPVEDNSLGRLFALSDGVFAIAMTLLALDLRVPDLGAHPTDAALRHALGQNSASYWSYLTSFYIVAMYWTRHRQIMRSVTTSHPRMVRDTVFLLLLVAAIPFPASLLGRYGSEPFALALYGAINALAVLTLVRLRRDVRRFGSAVHSDGVGISWETSVSLGVFLLCIPAGYLLGSNGPWVLLLLLLMAAGRLAPLWRRWRRWRRPAAGTGQA